MREIMLDNLVCHLAIRTIPFSSIRIGPQLLLHCGSALRSFTLPHLNSPSEDEPTRRLPILVYPSKKLVFCFSNLVQAESSVCSIFALFHNDVHSLLTFGCCVVVGANTVDSYFPLSLILQLVDCQD